VRDQLGQRGALGHLAQRAVAREHQLDALAYVEARLLAPRDVDSKYKRGRSDRELPITN
jgi:hypothetical protein